MARKLLSSEEITVWHAFKRLREAVMTRVEQEIVQATGVSGADFGVLSRLADLGKGELRQQALAESLGWDKSRLSHHLTRMQEKELIERRAADARGVLVRLTKEGRAKLDAARPVHAAAVRRHLLSRLSEQEMETMVRVSRMLSDEE